MTPVNYMQTPYLEQYASFGTKKFVSLSYFLSITLSNSITKSTIPQELRIAKIGNLFFIGFRTLSNFLEQKRKYATFEGKGLYVANWDGVKSTTEFGIKNTPFHNNRTIKGITNERSKRFWPINRLSTRVIKKYKKALGFNIRKVKYHSEQRSDYEWANRVKFISTNNPYSNRYF